MVEVIRARSADEFLLLKYFNVRSVVLASPGRPAAQLQLAPAQP